MMYDPNYLHKKFAKRKERVESKHKVPAPDTKKSDAGRKKLLKRSGVAGIEKLQSDCRGCDRICGYEHNLEVCPEKSAIHRCKQCGAKVRYRWIEGQPWELCPICTGG